MDNFVVDSAKRMVMVSDIKINGMDEIRESIKEQEDLLSWLKPDSRFGSSKECDLLEKMIENQTRIANLIEKIALDSVRRH